MQKMLLLMFMLTAIVSANLFEINLENNNKKSNDFLIQEATSHKENALKGYETLSKTFNNININMHTNINDMVGLKYSKNLSGIDYDSKGVYLGTPGMTYFGYDKINRNIDYGARELNKSMDKFTFLNLFTITKEKSRSSKIETLSTQKDALHDDVNGSVLIHRDFDLETFVLSTENLYDVVKNDLKRGEEYFNPLMYSKKINDNLSLYGVTILGLGHANYTNVSNYYNTNDANSTKTNISYNIDTGDGVPKIDYEGETTPGFFLGGRYNTYEYGLKLSAEYKIKDYMIYLTAYYKNVDMINKYEISDALKKKYNVIYFQEFKYIEQYVKFGLNYTF